MSEHRRKPKQHKCEQVRCANDGIACYLPDWGEEEKPDGRPDYYYCWDHASQNGFCRHCGQFWGGVESFEFSNGGYCDNCYDQIRSDFDDDRPSETEYDYWNDYEEIV